MFTVIVLSCDHEAEFEFMMGPDKPVIPGQPDKPVIPGQPDKPVIPGQPDKPVIPGQPDKPVIPGQWLFRAKEALISKEYNQPVWYPPGLQSCKSKENSHQRVVGWQ